MCSKIQKLSRSQQLAQAGLGCFLLSLMLPAFQMTMFGQEVTFAGWRAWGSSLAFALDGDNLSRDGVKYIFLGVSGLLNLVFVMMPVALMRTVRRKQLFQLSLATASGLILAVLSPWVLFDLITHLSVGFWLWILGYVLVMAAVIMAYRREVHDPYFMK